MAAVGLAQDQGRLSPDRLHLLAMGYSEVRPLSPDDLAELPTQIAHAALIIAFHRFYRHHVRFPDPAKAGLHLPLMDFVASIGPDPVIPRRH